MAINKKAIETAVKMETDAMKFYREALDKTSNPVAQKIFEDFIKAELRHLRMLNTILAGIDKKEKLVYPEEDTKTVFSELKDKMLERVKATSNEVEAIKIALDFEREGYHFYTNYSNEATSEEEKKLFKRLAAEEKKHYNFLEITNRFMEETGDWFKWDEIGLLDKF